MTTNSTIIEGDYLHDILDQPRALRETLPKLSDTPALGALVQRLDRGEYRRIVLTGMGSSFYAMYTVNRMLIDRGHTALVVETSELVHDLAGLLEPPTLIIAASQSGESAEIVRLMKVNCGRAFVVGVSNTPGSTLARRADEVVMTRAGAEATVSCKTYVATLAALTWLAARLCGRDLVPLQRELGQAADAGAAYLSQLRAHVRQLQVELEGVRHLFLVGRGRSLASAGTGGLIIKESDHFFAEGMGSAAFRHGPFEALSRDVFTVVFEGDPATRDLHVRLAEDVARTGARSVLVGAGRPGAWGLPDAPDSARPILEILPVQMITLALASLAGREAGKFERASKVTAEE